MKKLVAALAITVAFAMPAQAEFKLDARYTDADGDMVADIPTDASQLAAALACAGQYAEESL